MINRKAETLLEATRKAPTGLWIEIGCIRENHEVPTDGFSTIYLAREAISRGCAFISIDKDPNIALMANKTLIAHRLPAFVRAVDGKEFLQGIDDPISFLYFDSHRLPIFTTEQYIESHLASGAVIAVDDCHSFDNNKYGKGTHLVDIFEKQKIQYEIKDTEPGFKMLVAYFPKGKEKKQI